MPMLSDIHPEGAVRIGGGATYTGHNGPFTPSDPKTSILSQQPPAMAEGITLELCRTLLPVSTTTY